MVVQKFENTFEYKLIYIFRINDHEHKGCLKIGDATIKTSKKPEQLPPNSHDLNFYARKRIDDYTSTAGIVYDLLYTEIAVYKVKSRNSKKFGQNVAFRDHNVHDVLKRSNIKVKYFDTNKKQNEWFVVDLETAKKAIQCVKEEKKSLLGQDITYHNNPIVFRPEQNEAIKKTIKRFKESNMMLWNAKMRFGKTLSALQVAKEMNFEKTIIITHRPVVSDGWYDDFKKIFYDKKDYQFGSKVYGESSIKKLIKSKKPFVYFASIQDLRGSAIVGGKFDKNNEIFDIAWDFIVVDEAHEGTQTNLGKLVLEELINNKYKISPKVLELSGTPFNLLTDFEEASIYTWDYIMEQEAKQDWYLNHFGDSNPYEELPKMNIFTYHLEKYITGFMDVEDKAFNFKEFFRTWTGNVEKDGKQIPVGSVKGDFIHEKDIVSFLDLICKKSDITNYPFATDEYRDFFRHTLWVLPGVKEAKALSSILKNHHIFKHFEIVNVAGDGDEEIDTSDALKAVKKAMTKKPEETYTITLSCGRLTTGVSIPEWTAVLMLAGSYSTAASQYLQTIFRVQTPANINGRIKENCYVFDFAPDRTLKMIAESVQLSAKTKSKNPIAEKQLTLFLNFCPVISIEGTNMKEYKVSMLLQELKKAYAERVVKNGFDDSRLYNDELLKLDDVDLAEFEKLKKAVGTSVAGSGVQDIEINNEGFNKEEYEKVEKAQKKPKKELTDEEKKLLEELKKKKENRNKAISILRAISIRMPLLVYGMEGDIDTEITIENFVDLVDDLSWEEFMPRDVDKPMFKKFTKYYDKDVFISCARRIRYISKTADELEPTERIVKIAKLFSTFKNPDKETVLTPWRVVNMHMSNTIGGYTFFDEKFDKELDLPRFVDLGEQTKNIIYNENSQILEINSKTGLYPLYLTYSLYKYKCDLSNKELSFNEKLKIWDDVASNNIFVICKTKMAKSITRRTLVGYRTSKVNMHSFDDLIMQFRSKQGQFIQKITKPSFWNKGGIGQMKFNAIVGNPPYQLQDKGVNNSGDVARTSAISIYNLFVSSSKLISEQYVSLIIPSRWMTGGKGLDSFRKENIDDERFEIIHDYENDKEVFPHTDIGGGVMYFLWNKTHSGKLNYYVHNGENITMYNRYLNTGDSIIIRDYYSSLIVKKVKTKNSFMEIVSARKPFGFGADITRKRPELFSDIKNSIYDSEFFAWDGVPLCKYINEKEIDNKDLFYSYKVFISKTGDPYMRNGRINKTIIRMPFLGLPKSACSETYLTIGKYDNMFEPESIIKYIQTKFFRFLVLQKKKTQNVSRDIFEFVPLLDFSENSYINWNDTIENIDLQLYKHFEFTLEEIKYIDSMIDYFK